MDWEDWIGKTVYIKLREGDVFTFSKVLAYYEGYVNITDKYGLPVTININSITIIREERYERPI